MTASRRKVGIIGIGFGSQVYVPAFASEGWDVVAPDELQRVGVDVGDAGSVRGLSRLVRVSAAQRGHLPALRREGRYVDLGAETDADDAHAPIRCRHGVLLVAHQLR